MRLYMSSFLLSMSGLVAAATSSASETDHYLAALAAMDRDSALYSLMVDELLATRCERRASVEDLKVHATTLLPVLAALKAGQVDEARRLVRAIPCPVSEQP